MRYPKTIAAGIAVLSLLLLSRIDAPGEMYKWVDKNGTVHIQDYPPESGGKPMNLDAIPINRIGSTDNGRSGSSHRPAPGSSREYPAVEVYGTSWCPACKAARHFFRSRGIPFDDYDVERDKGARARMDRLGGGSGVPATVIGGNVFRGFSQKLYERALGIRP
jgi:glutaredoxin